MIVFTILIYVGRLSEDNYVEVMLWLYGIYAGTNVATKFTIPKDKE